MSACCHTHIHRANVEKKGVKSFHIFFCSLLSLPFSHLQHTQRASRMVPKTITDASQVHREWYPGASGMLPQTIGDAPQDHRVCSLGASWMVPRCIRYAWSKHRRCTGRASRMVLGCIADASQVHLGCYPRPSQMLPGTIRGALGACSSSPTTRSKTIPPRGRAGARGGPGAIERGSGPNEGRPTCRHRATVKHGPTPHPACLSEKFAPRPPSLTSSQHHAQTRSRLAKRRA